MVFADAAFVPPVEPDPEMDLSREVNLDPLKPWLLAKRFDDGSDTRSWLEDENIHGFRITGEDEEDKWYFAFPPAGWRKGTSDRGPEWTNFLNWTGVVFRQYDNPGTHDYPFIEIYKLHN